MNEGHSPTSYDILPYPRDTFPATHIGKIGAIGRLFGMQAVDPAGARVLELGCASGVNLLAMAQIFPDGEFIGIDSSQRQIQEGEDMLAATGVSNVRLIRADFSALEDDLRKFDYIIAHGIYSWVPANAKDAILRICSDNLAPHGIAYVSYNCLPGWHMRGGLRDMMLMHTRGFSDPLEKVAQAKALVKFLAESCAAETPYGKYLRNELELIRKADDGYIAHDYLESDNDPVYFTDFLEAASNHGLAYLGDADPASMITDNLPGPAAQTLQSLQLSLTETEQYMDFVSNRSFRRTLLCHSGVPLSRELEPSRLAGLHVTSRIAMKQDISEGAPAVFVSDSGGEFTVNKPVSAALFRHVSQLGKSSKPAADLLAAVAASIAGQLENFDPAQACENLSHMLLQSYFKKMVDFTIGAPGRRVSASTHPEALPLARYQAAHGNRITSPRLDMRMPDPFVAKLVALCDGSRDRSTLVAELLSAMENEEFKINEHNQPITDAGRAKFIIEKLMDSTLRNLSDHGVILAKI